jgi:hypothetical protein
MNQMEVIVPAGVSPGMPFTVNTPAGQMQVTCPPDAHSGAKMIVNVPVMQVAAVPTVVQAAPQPMMMAMEIGAPQTVITPATGASEFEFSMELDVHV